MCHRNDAESETTIHSLEGLYETQVCGRAGYRVHSGLGSMRRLFHDSAPSTLVNLAKLAPMFIIEANIPPPLRLETSG